MKKISKTLVLFSAFVLCLVSLFGPAITAQAEEAPVTYCVKYIPDSDEWRYQTGSWVDGNSHRELYYLKQAIKDGDLLVIDGDHDLLLEVNASLSNLTIVHSTGAVITAKSIDNFYAINGSVSAINGNVTNAEVYDNCIVNFNNSVKTLKMLSEREDILSSSIAVAGTVDHLYAAGKNYKHFEFYSFAANTLRIENGALKTDAANYSQTPAEATVVPTEAPAATTPAATTTTTTTTSGEYDDVPKTGDIRFNPLWLVGIAAACLIGSYELKKNR